MNTQKLFFSSCCLLICICFFTCRKDKGMLDYTISGYPQEIGKIMIGKCATPGCHTKQSKDASAGINLETWDDMFAGGKAGACCIPYSHEYSTIFLFTNTDSSKGAVNMPTMPLNHEALSAAEMKTLTEWIDAGAPDSKGKIMWADNPNRKKFYVTNQGCDVVTVFDAATLLQMRYIPIGIVPGGFPESPHMLKISPDGKYWYVSFLAGTVFQKFKTSDDSHVGDINIGPGSWNTFAITPDSKNAFVVDWNSSGNISYLDLQTMMPQISYGGVFVWPHGSMVSPDGKYLYATGNKSNILYKTDVSDPFNPNFLSDISLDGTPAGSTLLSPHDLAYTPDSLYYFVTCETENTVRAFKSSNDSLIASIPVGKQPVELSFSKTTPRLFVSCMDDDSTAQVPYRGSVSIIDYTNFTLVKNMKATYIVQPHGIGVDDARGLVYVANRNITSGPAPHHSTSCGGRVGFMSFIDLNTLQLLSKTVEIAKDPYSVAVRK